MEPRDVRVTRPWTSSVKSIPPSIIVTDVDGFMTTCMNCTPSSHVSTCALVWCSLRRKYDSANDRAMVDLPVPGSPTNKRGIRVTAAMHKLLIIDLA
jgi:hypothetical protein